MSMITRTEVLGCGMSVRLQRRLNVAESSELDDERKAERGSDYKEEKVSEAGSQDGHRRASWTARSTPPEITDAATPSRSSLSSSV